jgi:hypothetical protein
VGVVCRFWLTGYQIPVKEKLKPNLLSRFGFNSVYIDWILEEGFFLLFFGELMGLDRLVYHWFKLDKSCVLTHFIGWFGPFGRIKQCFEIEWECFSEAIGSSRVVG